MKAWILIIITCCFVGCATPYSVPVPRDTPPAVAAIWNKQIPSLDFKQATWTEVVQTLDDFAVHTSGGKVRVHAQPWPGPKNGGPPRVTYKAKYIPFGEAIWILPQFTHNNVRFHENDIQYFHIGYEHEEIPTR